MCLWLFLCLMISILLVATLMRRSHLYSNWNLFHRFFFLLLMDMSMCSLWQLLYNLRPFWFLDLSWSSLCYSVQAISENIGGGGLERERDTRQSMNLDFEHHMHNPHQTLWLLLSLSLLLSHLILCSSRVLCFLILPCYPYVLHLNLSSYLSSCPWCLQSWHLHIR